VIRKKIIIRPAEDLTLFSLSLLISYYLGYPVPLFILIACVLWRTLVHRSSLFIIGGVLAGLLLQGMADYNRLSSYTGLPLDSVERATFLVSEDSFLSSKGNRIVRASLETVVGPLGLESSAAGEVLLIGSSENPVIFQGELISMDCSLVTMEDSREFAYIGFWGKSFRREGWSSEFFRLRKKLIEHFDRRSSFMSPSVKALFLALFRGNSDSLSPELKENFRKGGVPQLLALSGFHVAIVVLLITMLIKPLTGYKFAALAALPLLISYLFFAGTSPSLVRAVIMFSFAAFFRLLNRSVPVLSLLFLTAVLQLFIRPGEGWSLSFQLSYLALGGLVIAGKRAEAVLESSMPSFLSLPLSASIGAHLFTVPLLLVSFGEIFPAGLISSLAVTPLIVLFMWSSLISYIFILLPSTGMAAQMLDRFNSLLVQLIEEVVGIFALVPSIPFSLNPGTVVYFILLSIVVIYLYRSLWRQYGRREKAQFKLRFPFRDQSSAGIDGIGPPEKMESEFSH
jgi:ComEC/Rec2-related protein